MTPLLFALVLFGQAGKPLVVGDLLPDIQVQGASGTWLSLVDHLDHKPSIILRLAGSSAASIIELSKASEELAKLGYLSIILSDIKLHKKDKRLDCLSVPASKLSKYFPEGIDKGSILYVVDSSAEVREVDLLADKSMEAAQIIKAAKDVL